MKNYNRILEAVNRGIQLALDDFDDEEQVQNIKSKQVQNRDYTKEYLDFLKDELVDLGLPSGTLWCKYNLGVDINNTTSQNQLIGDYYAWGEITPNKLNKLNNNLYNYSWYTYKFARGARNQLTKYLNGNTDFAAKKDLHHYTLKPGESIRYNDNLSQLLQEDDAAYQNKKPNNFNFKFHIPTKEQFEELINYTTFKTAYGFVKNHELKFSECSHFGDDTIYTYGMLLTSKINGNQLFFPMGSYKDSESHDPFQGGHYWTSDIKHWPCTAYIMCCGSDFIKIFDKERYCGLNIRPVINL